MSEPTVLREASFDPKVKQYYMVSAVLLCVVTVIGIPFLLIVIPLGTLFIQKWLDNLSCRLTTGTLEIRKGILSKVESTIPLEKITDLQLYQGPIMRMLGLQGFRVETAGQTSTPGGSLVNMVGIVNTREFREAVLAQRDVHEQSKRGERPAERSAAPGLSGEDPLLRETVEILRRIEAKLPDAGSTGGGGA